MVESSSSGSWCRLVTADVAQGPEKTAGVTDCANHGKRRGSRAAPGRSRWPSCSTPSASGRNTSPSRSIKTSSHAAKHSVTTVVAPGDVLEVVTLVGGGAGPGDDQNRAARRSVTHQVPEPGCSSGQANMRLLELMRRFAWKPAVRKSSPSLCAGSGCSTARDETSSTISIRAQSTRSCPIRLAASRSADALRTARLGRELLLGLENPGADWVKLEVLADARTLLPDPDRYPREATRILVKEGFQSSLLATSDDPGDGPPGSKRPGRHQRHARRQPDWERARSAQCQQHPDHSRGLQEWLDPSDPVIVDAGVGTASDVTIAMELGCDGVLLNTRHRRRVADPLTDGRAPPCGWRSESGWLAGGAGRIPRKLYAGPRSSSPTEGVIGETVDLKERRPSRKVSKRGRLLPRPAQELVLSTRIEHLTEAIEIVHAKSGPSFDPRPRRQNRPTFACL